MMSRAQGYAGLINFNGDIFLTRADMAAQSGNGLIDPHPVPRVIAARLSSLGQTAKSGSHPVGVGFVYPETLSEVRTWIATLEGQNLQLAPATSALK